MMDERVQDLPGEPWDGDAEAAEPSGRELLADLVGMVGRLSSGGGQRPSRVQVRFGRATVEVEWAGPPPMPDGGSTGADVTDEEPAPDTGLVYVTTPLVGTFYRAPGPGAAPFVVEGDEVVAGQQLGIVESMKLMNAITADRAGRVAKVLVSDGDSVEFDERLVALIPATASLRISLSP